MEGEKRKIEIERKDNEICYSKAIKAGKRIYYLDVKKSRNNDLYLAITESKKKVVGYNEDTQITYEKHKIFLYREDFDKFVEGLQDVIGFITQEQGAVEPRAEYTSAQPTFSPEADEPALISQSELGEQKRNFFDKFKF